MAKPVINPPVQLHLQAAVGAIEPKERRQTRIKEIALRGINPTVALVILGPHISGDIFEPALAKGVRGEDRVKANAGFAKQLV
jgi:hypothetical protein